MGEGDEGGKGVREEEGKEENFANKMFAGVTTNVTTSPWLLPTVCWVFLMRKNYAVNIPNR